MPTYAEIQAQIEQLQADAEKIRQDNMSTAIAQIRALMKEHGVTLDDLSKANGKESSASSPIAKYRDPETGNSWSGRGKKPGWFKRHIEAGESEESLLVKP